eukprot:8708891-Pyramimonas_sp.AAC.1
MPCPHPVQQTPHTLRCTIGSSTEGPRGRVRMACPHPIRRTSHRFRGPTDRSQPLRHGNVPLRSA